MQILAALVLVSGRHEDETKGGTDKDAKMLLLSVFVGQARWPLKKRREEEAALFSSYFAKFGIN